MPLSLLYGGNEISVCRSDSTTHAIKLSPSKHDFFFLSLSPLIGCMCALYIYHYFIFFSAGPILNMLFLPSGFVLSHTAVAGVSWGISDLNTEIMNSPTNRHLKFRFVKHICTYNERACRRGSLCHILRTYKCLV